MRESFDQHDQRSQHSPTGGLGDVSGRLPRLKFHPLATPRNSPTLPAIIHSSTTQPGPRGIAPDVLRRHRRLHRVASGFPRCARSLLTILLGTLSLSAPAGDLERAEALYQEKHYAEAQPIFAKILETEPGNASAAYHLGALALRRGEVAEAVKQLEVATRLAPTSGRYQQELGDACGAAAGQASLISKIGLARKALAAYQRAIKLEPEDIEHRLRLMNYFVQAPSISGGGIEKAYDVAEAIRIRDQLQGALAIITLHLGQKRWAQAFAEVDALQPLHSGDRDFNYLLARLTAASGQQLDRGEAALLHYLSLPPSPNPATPAQANFLLGSIREKAGNPAGAIAAYRAAVAFDANLAAARQALDRLQPVGAGKRPEP